MSIIRICRKEHSDIKHDEGKFERCVLCGELTDVEIDTPVDKRKTYVKGSGQLCRACCIDIYGTDDLTYLAK